MPIGSYALVPHVAHALVRHQPHRVLDLGIGFGLYGAVVRQWLDQGVRPWRTNLTGVEAFASYRNPTWDLYNLIVINPIQEFLVRDHALFDFILLLDVVEHFERPEAIWVLDRCKRLLSPRGCMMVGTPAIFMEQGAVGGNEFERHRSLWTVSDFIERGYRIEKNGDPDAFGHQMILAAFVPGGSSTC